jgi:Flp pilus assembly protein CpaB
MNAPDVFPSPLSTGRRVAGRSSRPNGRAALGALLVVLSGVGLYIATVSSTKERMTTYVVAAKDITRGHIVTPADVRTEPMRLGSGVSQRAFPDPSVLVGAVALVPLSAGELIQVSAVQQGGAALRDMSFPIEASRAVAGDISPGDRIDVVATFDRDGATVTETVLRGLDVLAIDGTTLDAASSTPLVIRVGVNDHTQQEVLAHAVNSAKLFVVRANDASSTPQEAGSTPLSAGSIPQPTRTQP